MDNEIKNCKTLKELEESWQTAHKNEDDYKCDFGNINKTSFCPDGIVDEDSFSNKEKILFIAKESNCGRNNTEILIDIHSVNFWLKDCVNGTGKSSPFSNRLAMMANAYYENNYVFNKEQKENYNNLRYTALINLNKRGGLAIVTIRLLQTM